MVSALEISSVPIEPRRAAENPVTRETCLLATTCRRSELRCVLVGSPMPCNASSISDGDERCQHKAVLGHCSTSRKGGLIRTRHRLSG